MKLQLNSLLIVFLSLSPMVARSADSDLEVHRLKAQKYIDAKDWTSAEPEAKAVVDADAKDKDGWLVYGVIEQRLEHNEAAAKAYHKYLDLNPPEDKAVAVRKRLAEVEIRTEKQVKEKSQSNEEKYGPLSSSVFFSFAPVYNPSTSYVLGGNVSNNFQLGFQFQKIIVGLQYDTGTIPSFLAPQTGATSSNVTYSTVGPATLKTYVLFVEYNFVLTEPFIASTGPFSIFIPIHFGLFSNSIQLNTGSRSFSNMGGELASGIGAQWFTRSPFSAALTALYHQGMSMYNLAEDSSSQPIENLNGTPAGGGNVGFEIKLTLSYLFGYEPSIEQKAGVN